METTTRLITIAGFARNGKDTMYSILSHCLNSYYNSRCQNLKLADSLRRMVQEECIEKHGINAWTEHPEEKQIIRNILIDRAVSERAQNPDVFCENLFNHGTIRPNVMNIITDLRYPNELAYVSNEILFENRFHVWVNRGPNFGPVGEEEKKYTTQLLEEHKALHNSVVYDWNVDMEGAGWNVWDKDVRTAVEEDVMTKVVKPMLEHFGESIFKKAA